MKPWQKRLVPVVRVRPDARKNLLTHFNKLPMREGLRFWIPIEVDSLIELAGAQETISPPLTDADWDAEAREALRRIGKQAQRLDKCFQSLPPVAFREVLKEVAPATGTPLWLGPFFFKKLAEAMLGLASNRPPANPKGGRPSNPSDSVAAYYAKRIAEDYELLTGKCAAPGSDRKLEESGRRNEFERLLEKVYTNLGIDASAEVQARKLKAREKTKSK
jgi:hypothetical protein